MEDGDYPSGLPAGVGAGAGAGDGAGRLARDGMTTTTTCACCQECSSRPRPRRWTAAMEKARARATRLPVLWEAEEVIGEVEGVGHSSLLAHQVCPWPAAESHVGSPLTAEAEEIARRPSVTWAWLSAPKAAGAEGAVLGRDDVGRIKSYRNWLPPLGLTTWRLYAALAISIIPSCSWLTVTTPRTASDAHSSLLILISHLHAKGPLDRILQLIPPSLAALRFPSLALLAQPLLEPGNTPPPPIAESFTAHAWALAKTSLLRRGYPHALWICLLAILTHHIRRTLVPWLGQGLYGRPLAHLKLAAGAPLPFIDAALSVTWSRALPTLPQKALFDCAGCAALSVLVADAQLHLYSGHGSSTGGSGVYSRPALDTAQVFYVAWLLSGLENFYTQTSVAASFALAYPRLVHPLAPRSYSSALLRTLHSHASALPLHAWFMYDTTSTFASLLRGALGAAAVGRAGLLVALVGAAAGTGYVVRFSNWLYMVLEMGGLVMVLALCFGACAVLGREALGHHLWVPGSGFGDGQGQGVGVPASLKPSFMA